MNRGLIIQCGGCGFSRFVDLNGSAEQIEAELHRTVGVEGWRFVRAWDGYLCPKCRSAGTDPFYEAFAGKPKPAGKTASYKELLLQAVRQLQMFMELERL